jgi:hypothetical protein
METNMESDEKKDIFFRLDENGVEAGRGEKTVLEVEDMVKRLCF